MIKSELNQSTLCIYCDNDKKSSLSSFSDTHYFENEKDFIIWRTKVKNKFFKDTNSKNENTTQRNIHVLTIELKNGPIATSPVSFIKIEGSPTSPSVVFDESSGYLELKGRSLLENAEVFYNPVISLLEKHIKSSPHQIRLNIHLEYLNTESSKFILSILKETENSKNGSIIKWFFEEGDEEMKTKGIEFQSLINKSIEMVEIELSE